MTYGQDNLIFHRRLPEEQKVWKSWTRIKIEANSTTFQEEKRTAEYLAAELLSGNGLRWQDAPPCRFRVLEHYGITKFAEEETRPKKRTWTRKEEKQILVGLALLKMAGTPKIDIMANFQNEREKQRIRDDLAELKAAGIPKEVRDEFMAELTKKKTNNI